MFADVKTLFSGQRRHLLPAFLSLVVLFAYTPVFVLTIDATDATHVNNETELVNAVNNTLKPTVIVLDNDITLFENPLVIPNDKDIMLMSNED